MLSRRDFTRLAGVTAGALLAEGGMAGASLPQAPTAAAPITSGTLSRPDAEIYYEVCGSGPAIVFVHGLGGNHLSWWQQVPEFSPRYTCVTFAHRGFAPSRSSAVEPSLFADDLLALVDHLQLKRVRLVAQSMGGWTCLDFALRHPDRVQALVMADTGGTVDWQTLSAEARAQIDSWLAAHKGADADLRKRGIHPAAGERMAREQPALQFLYREIDEINKILDKEALRARLLAARTVPASELKSLTMPVLFISGQEDIVYPPPAVAAIAAATPQARFESFAEAGHSVYFERAAAFNRTVRVFFEGSG